MAKVGIEGHPYFSMSSSFVLPVCVCMLVKKFISNISYAEMESAEIRAKIRPPGRLLHWKTLKGEVNNRYNWA